MRRKMKIEKRRSFLRIASGFLAGALLLTLGFGLVFRWVMDELIRANVSDMGAYAFASQSVLVERIHKFENRSEQPMRELDGYLSMQTHCAIDVPFSSNKMLQSDVDENCYSMSLIIDSDRNIMASNREKLVAPIKLPGDEAYHFYTCEVYETDDPMLQKFYEDWLDYSKGFGALNCGIELHSAYIDRENYRFIPYEGIMHHYYSGDEDESDERPDDRYGFTLGVDPGDYELVEFSQNPDELPRAFSSNFYGTAPEVFDKLIETLWQVGTDYTETISYNGEELLMSSRSIQVSVQGENYVALQVCVIDPDAPIIRRVYWFWVLAFLGVAIVIALLLSWRRWVVNRARCDYQDYQRTLVNNLAHDMKTPLAAISGYAENAVRSLEKGGTEGVEVYLDSILENVAYTDSIVNRTLELSKLQNEKPDRTQSVELHTIAERALERYALMLEEKDITTEINGEFTLIAEPDSISSAVENLISNAVKYTPEHGKITVTADSTSLTVANTAAEKIDITDLTTPFLHSDKTKGSRSGSGLGLAIVHSAAELNKLTLTLESKDDRFTARLSK